MRGRRDPRGLIVRCAGALASATGIVGLLGLAPIQWPGALALTAGGLAVALLTPRVRRAPGAPPGNPPPPADGRGRGSVLAPGRGGAGEHSRVEVGWPWRGL